MYAKYFIKLYLYCKHVCIPWLKTHRRAESVLGGDLYDFLDEKPPEKPKGLARAKSLPPGARSRSDLRRKSQGFDVRWCFLFCFLTWSTFINIYMFFDSWWTHLGWWSGSRPFDFKRPRILMDLVSNEKNVVNVKDPGFRLFFLMGFAMVKIWVVCNDWGSYIVTSDFGGM